MDDRESRTPRKPAPNAGEKTEGDHQKITSDHSAHTDRPASTAAVRAGAATGRGRGGKSTQGRKNKGAVKGGNPGGRSAAPPLPPSLRSTSCEKTPETSLPAPVAAEGEPGGASGRGKGDNAAQGPTYDRDYLLKGKMGATKATGTRGPDEEPEEEDEGPPDTSRDEPGGVAEPVTAETGGTPARQQAAVDALMEESGISTVDERDAEEWRLIREAKIGALRNLKEEMDAETDRAPKDKMTAPELANVGQKLGQMEKDKMGVIQLKVGKPSDRVRGGMRFKAKIGVQSGGAEGAPAQAVVELEAEEDDG